MTTETTTTDNPAPSSPSDRSPVDNALLRTRILELTVVLGQSLVPHFLGQQADSHVPPLDVWRDVWQCLQAIVTVGRLDWHAAVRAKLHRNAVKYPVALCHGKAGKYTDYSHVTGITARVNQQRQEQEPSTSSITTQLTTTTTAASSPPQTPTNRDGLPLASTNDTTTGADTAASTPKEKTSSSSSCAWVPEMTQAIVQFSEERDWQRFHTPRNLVLALMGEVGELCEVVQFCGDAPTGKMDQWQLQQETADVSIYLLRLASVCHVAPTVFVGLETNNNTNQREEESPAWPN